MGCFCWISWAWQVGYIDGESKQIFYTQNHIFLGFIQKDIIGKSVHIVIRIHLQSQQRHVSLLVATLFQGRQGKEKIILSVLQRDCFFFPSLLAVATEDISIYCSSYIECSYTDVSMSSHSVIIKKQRPASQAKPSQAKPQSNLTSVVLGLFPDRRLGNLSRGDWSKTPCIWRLTWFRRGISEHALYSSRYLHELYIYKITVRKKY